MSDQRERWLQVERGGVTLRVHVAGEGTPLLYLHGLGYFGEPSRLEVPAGYRLATYDQRGHGSATPCTDPSDYAIGAFTADALAVLDALGWQRAALGGMSMGSSIALRIALDHPERVSRLLLAAPAFGDAPNPAAARFAAMADAIESRGIEAWLASLETGSETSEASAARLASWVGHPSASLVAALRGVGPWTPFRSSELCRSKRSCPAVVVAWPGDPMHPLDLARRVARALATPLHQLPDAETALADPSRVARAFEAALGDDYRSRTSSR